MNLGLVVALPAGLAMLHPLLALGRPSGEAQPCLSWVTVPCLVAQLCLTLWWSDISVGKESACNAGDPGSIPESEDPLEKG